MTLLRLAPVPIVLLIALSTAPGAYEAAGSWSSAASAIGPLWAPIPRARVLFWIGEFALIFFFLSIPYILASVVAAALLILHSWGEITLTPPPTESNEQIS
ncbi:hypothetical protein LQ948_03695 [Jiella sp. MQZ9-1]|uniref:Uncharacterized protein n=1 Tax=Jiella flava TaxID=2816857 RepID=A0A939FVQ4_9HYPH|nr:hypothetical protein [Jiella flava]MBO0661666.1 hypothetical protein [Jiella flava]MCD2470308.1 hypothetical protein [Jiella flava]